MIRIMYSLHYDMREARLWCFVMTEGEASRVCRELCANGTAKTAWAVFEEGNQ